MADLDERLPERLRKHLEEMGRNSESQKGPIDLSPFSPEQLTKILQDRFARGYTTEDVMVNEIMSRLGLPIKQRRGAYEVSKPIGERGNLNLRLNPEQKEIGIQYTVPFEDGGSVDSIDIFADGGFVGDRPHPRERDFPVGGPAWKAREAARAADIDVFDYLPSTGQAANVGGMLLPGSGYLDYFGGYATVPSGDQPFSEAFSGEHYPSFAENIQRGGFGGYFDAAMQGLGVAGDTMYALPLVGAVTGPTIGTGLKAAGAAGKLIKRGIGALSRGADEGISVIDTSTDVASALADQRRLSEGIASLNVPTPPRSGAEATPIPEAFDQSEIFSLDPVGTSAIAQRNADDLGRVNFPESAPAPRDLIKPTTKGKGGRIPGAPAHVKTPADEQRAIDDYLNQAELGAAGAFWYSNTAKRIDLDVGNVLGARPGAADRAAAVIGEFSPRATLEANRLAQVRAFNQHATGLPVAAGMAPRNKAAQGILDTGKFSAEGALKVGPFSMQVRGLSVPRGVHDVRDIKSWGYGDVQATGEANHRWMDRMQDQAVKLANERRLAGRSDWTHEQLQAARWVKHKADDMGVDIAELTSDFGPADQWLAANVFSEAAPSQELMNVGALSADDMRTYTALHQNIFTNPSGQDVLAHQLGLLSPNSTRFVGEWDGAFNPNIVTRIMADPAKGADVISEWSQEAIAFHGGLRGLLGGQADVAISFLRKPKLVGNTNAYRIPFNRVVTEADIASYKNAAQKALREADVPGDVVVNFRNDKELELTWLIFDETDKVQKKAFRKAIEGITDGRGIPARNSGGLLTYEDRFKPSAWMEKLQNPLMRSKVEDMLPRIAADIERDLAKLPLTDTGQEIYQRTVTFIKEGGLAAVENAVKQGILPAAVIGALLLGSNQAPQLPFSSQGHGQPRT
jgi:hypothetical protein